MNRDRIWTLGATLVTVAVLALGWLLGVAPKLAEGDASIADRANVEAQNAAQEAALVQLRDQFENLGSLQANLADLQTAIPDRPAIESFIDELAAIAGDTGVTVTAISASEAIPYAGAAAEGEAPAPVDPAAAPAGGLFTIPISVTVTGSPEQVFDFTGAVQSGTRLALVTVVDFYTGSGEGSGGTIAGHVFVMRGEAPSVPASPDGTAPQPSADAG